MFDLQDRDVEQLHTRYLEGEDIELTFDRLTAPFDCDLFDGLCDQVGEQQAIAITGELVELGLEGATPEEIETYLDTRLVVAMDGLEAQDSEDLGFRSGTSSSSLAYDQIGSLRLRARNGITTPVIGDRRAWTEATAQQLGVSGWRDRNAALICADAGPNDIDYIECDANLSCATFPKYSTNPPTSCVSGQTFRKVQTSHDRTKAWSESPSGELTFLTLTARGCANAEIDDTKFNACAPAHSLDY